MQPDSESRLSEFFSKDMSLSEAFECLFENAPDAIYILDMHGRFVAVNRKAEELTGFKREDYIGKSFREIIPAKTLSKAIRGFLSVIRGKSIRLELELKTAAKKNVQVEVTSTPFISNGKIVGTLGIARDLTEHKIAEEALESESYLETILNSIFSGVVVVDGETHEIVDANPNALETIGASREHVIGKVCHSFICPAEKGKCPVSDLGQTVDKSERVLLKADGQRIPILKTVSMITWKGHKYLIESLIDITEHKQAEEALQKSEERFSTLMEEAPIGICNTDLKGKITYVNKRFQEATGYSREEIVGKNGFALGIMSDETLKLFAKRMKERLMGKPSRILEGRFKRKDGEWIWAEIESRVIKKFGVPVGFQLIARDITERKRAEEERKGFEEKLSALNTYSRSLNTAKSMEEIYELTLDAVEKTFGFEFADILIMKEKTLCLATHRGYSKLSSLELPLDGDKGITAWAARTGKPVLVPDVSKEEAYVEGGFGMRSELAVPIKIGNKVLGVLNVESKELDAFDEKDQELLEILASHAAIAISSLEKRREIEKRSSQLASLLKSSTDMISTTDLRQRLEKIAEAIRTLGWRRAVIYVTDENLEIRSLEDIVAAGITPEEREYLWSTRQPGQVYRERFGPKFESFKIGEFYYLPWSDPFVRKSFSEDTLPSKLSPEEMIDWDPQDLLMAPLRLAEGRFVGMLSIDDPLDGRRPTKESLAPLELFLHQAAVAIENAQLFRLLNEAKKQIKGYADQLELKVEERTKELMEAQNRLLKAERLAAIGEVAAMVGHDLRNPLTGIAGAIYYLKTKLGSNMDPKAMEMAELIEKDIEHSNNIITDLLNYSKEIRLKTTETTPKTIMMEALSLVKVPESIQVFDLTQREPKINVDLERMKRVFVNIIKNAVDAMPEGGKLSVKSNEADGSLEVAFTDTGTGMSKDVTEKIGTPLFTTKSRGMGLGLSICKRIVEAHGGNISVKSTVGEGTTFTVAIPINPKLEGGEKVWLKPPESLLLTTTKA